MIVVSEDLLAITKLQCYIDNCTDMDMAKKICRSFLKKYDTPTVDEPTLLRLEEHKRSQFPYNYNIGPISHKEHKISYEGQVIDVKTFGARVSVNCQDLCQYDKETVKVRLLRGVLDDMIHKIYEKGYIYNIAEIDYSTNSYNVKFNLDVLDTKQFRQLPVKTLESI